MKAGEVIPIIIGLVGLGTVIFAALRFRRDDTTAVVGQQTQILQSMKTLNDELRITSDRMRTERDECKENVNRLHGQVEALRDELRNANERLSGQVADVQKTLDDDSSS